MPKQELVSNALKKYNCEICFNHNPLELPFGVRTVSSTMPMGNPAPLGLLAFGITTATLMFVEMGWVEHHAEQLVYGYAAFFGGLTQLLVGFFELFKGSTFSYTVFSSYGCFWLGWAAVYIERANTESTFGAYSYTDGKTVNLALWGLLTCCFWVITTRKSMCLVVVFALLATTFFLLSAATHTGSDGVKKTAGYVGLLTALGAIYTAVAELVNEEWGRHVLPGLKLLHQPERESIAASGVSKYLSYDPKSNTMMMNFRGLHINSKEDVDAIRTGVEKKISEVPAAEGRVHVVVDYTDSVIADYLVNDYWNMVTELQKQFYLSAKRFNVTSFGRGEQLPAIGMVSVGSSHGGRGVTAQARSGEDAGML